MSIRAYPRDIVPIVGRWSDMEGGSDGLVSVLECPLVGGHRVEFGRRYRVFNCGEIARFALGAPREVPIGRCGF